MIGYSAPPGIRRRPRVMATSSCLLCLRSPRHAEGQPHRRPLQVMVAAAGSDAEIAEMYRNRQQARYKDQRRVARSLARKGTLRAGLLVTQATDIVLALRR